MEITAFFLRRLGFQRINFRRINSKLHSFKVFSLVSLLILGLFLTACSANKDEKVTDEGENQVIANTEDTEENPSEEATEEETAEAETVKTETAEHKWRTLKSIAEGTYDTEHSTSKTTDETEEPENFTQKNTTEPSGDLEEVRIGYPSSGQNFPVGLLGVADYKGYLDEYLVPLGYKSVPLGFVGNAPAINEALVAEELDFVVYTGMAGVLSRANGIEHTLLSITSWGNGGGWKIIAGTDSGIESIADLKGKKIAYTRGASPHMYLIRVLEEAGVAFEEIEPLNMNPTEGAAGVASGSVDATVVFAGFEAELVKNGIAKVIHSQFKADEDVYYEPTLFIARTAYYNEHRDVAIAIQKGLLKSQEWAKEDPDRYFRMTSEQSGNPLEVVLETANYDIDDSHPMNLDDRYINSLKNILKFLQDYDLTSGEVDFDSWVDDSVIEQAKGEYSIEKKAE